MKKFVIIGEGGYLADIFDIIHANGGQVAKLYQNVPEVRRDRVPSLAERISSLGYPIEVFDSLGTFEVEDNYEYVLGCITPLKYKLVHELKTQHRLELTSLIHPHALIGSHVHLGEGVIVAPGVVIAPNAYLDDFCTINRSTCVGHDSRIGKYSRLAPCVNLAGLSRIGDYCSIGIGATIIDRIHIGSWSTIGAGSLVTKDIPDSVIAYGVPAKVIKENKER